MKPVASHLICEVFCPHKRYKDALICYGIGNFLFNSDIDFEGWYEGYVVDLKISNRIDFEIHPYKQSLSGVALLDDKERNEKLRFIEELSLVITNPAELRGKWNRFVESNRYQYLRTALRINKYVWKLATIFRMREPLIKALASNKLYNTIRCEAHRGVVLELFERKGL